MASKLEQFLQEKGIDPRRVIVASEAIEALRPADRRILCLRRRDRRKEDGAKKPEPTGEAATKPRSGKPVSVRVLRDATAGKPVPSAAKTRVVRAINRVLEQQKQPPVDLRALF
ncbi:MAG: hypothetical protein JW751_06150 [Polyangiaceae bacterium]|nr:hypothetical protein [Polyangiaceae bacterium]